MFFFYVLGHRWLGERFLMDYSPHWLAASPQTCSVVICLLMTRSSCKYIIGMCETVEEFSMEVCVERRGEWHGPLSPLRHISTLTGHFTPGFRIPSERPPQTLPELSLLGENVTPSPLNTTFELLPTDRQCQICPTGEIMTHNFFKKFLLSPPLLFLFFFTWKSEKNSSREWISTAALVAWPLATGKEEVAELYGRH